MNDSIKPTVPGSFADLMSQSPPPTGVRQKKTSQMTKTPSRTVPKNPVKETQNSQMPQQSKEEIPSTHQEMKEVNHDVMTSPRHDVNYRVWKEAIEDTETHNSSLRLTNEENYAAEDMINELRRKLKVKTSLNEVARIGLLYIIHDFKQDRENSLIYKVKKS